MSFFVLTTLRKIVTRWSNDTHTNTTAHSSRWFEITIAEGKIIVIRSGGFKMRLIVLMSFSKCRVKQENAIRMCAWNHLIMQILLVWPHTRLSHSRIQYKCTGVNDFRIRMIGCIDSDISEYWYLIALLLLMVIISLMSFYTVQCKFLL